jgi:membrane fusion protein (multidrug efflux system)
MEAKEDISAAESGSSEAALRQTTPVGSEALHKTTERLWRPVPDDRSKSFRDRIQDRRWQIVGAIAVVAIVAVAGWYLWNYLHSYEWTDDAQIDGHLNPISPRINGTIIQVHVEDTYHVKKGDPLVDIDPRDYQVALDLARANLGQARAALVGARHDYGVAAANLAQAAATNTKAQRDFDRYQKLYKDKVISLEQYEDQVRIAQVDDAQLLAARASEGAAATLVNQREAAAAAAQAALDQAGLNLSYTHIVAPVAGVIGEKTAEVGEHVEPGQGLLAIVQLDDIWVTANFRENQVREMHRGQGVTIHVDATDADYNGYVEGLGGASGDKFSLLPPENATGNYVKVVQRLPVRLRFSQGEDPQRRLRPGMSVEPTVWLSGH